MPETIRTKIVGVSKGNRQTLIEEEVIVGDLLTLEREPDNAHDPNAIAILIENFGDEKPKKLGYISGELASDLAPLMDDGQEIDCQVLNITGGDEENKTLGVNVELTILSLDETNERMARVREKYNLNSPKPVPTQAPKKKKASILFILSIPIAIIGSCLVLIGIIGFTGISQKITLEDKFGIGIVSSMFFFTGLILFIPLIYSLVKRMIANK